MSDDHPARTPFCPGVTVWLTGLPSAGKSTIAHGCEPALRARGMRVEVLDGDAVRPHLAAARGYSREDRAVNIRRIGWVAELLARNGVAGPRLGHRPVPGRAGPGARRARGQRHRLPGGATSAPRWRWRRERDVKGLYARQRAGEISGLTGVDDPYEVPLNPELVIDAHEHPSPSRSLCCSTTWCTGTLRVRCVPDPGRLERGGLMNVPTLLPVPRLIDARVAVEPPGDGRRELGRRPQRGARRRRRPPRVPGACARRSRAAGSRSWSPVARTASRSRRSPR